MTTLHSKLKTVDVEVLLGPAVLLDFLIEAKIFSLTTQKSDTNLIETVSSAEATKRS